MSEPITSRLLMLLFFLLSAASQLYADDFTSALETQHEKESYSIGYQVGLSMKSDGVEVDFEKLILGLRD